MWCTDGAWDQGAILPRSAELTGSGVDPAPNQTAGFLTSEECLRTHYNLLREDFVRPLRTTLAALQRGETPPREVRLHEGVRIPGARASHPALSEPRLFTAAPVNRLVLSVTEV